ncbi:MAG: RlmE family RNA methyltransferase [Sulfurifustaceae bacterium]
MSRSKSSQAWLQRHFRDPYVKRARQEGVRSRARYKLAEIDAREKLLRPGMIVVDLGAAPGGWSEYVAKRIKPNGRVVAVDILPLDPIPGVDFILGNFLETPVLDSIKTRLDGPADLVISDMAPNITGIAATDQARAMELAEKAVEFAETALRPGGAILLKTFQGTGFAELMAELRRCFSKVATRKPGASRNESREVYLLAKGFTGRQSTSEHSLSD